MKGKVSVIKIRCRNKVLGSFPEVILHSHVLSFSEAAEFES
jgi:hypothetical protein